MKAKLFAFALAVFAALVMPQTALAQAPEMPAADLDTKYAVDMLKPGTAAPDFTLTSLDGKPVSLSDFRGKPVVIDFWASWCPDCRKDAPAMVELHRQFADKGIVFLGVSFDTNRESWAAAVKKYGIGYTQVSNLKKWKETEVSKAYHVDWIPAIYVVDADGKVVLGTVMSAKLKGVLEKLAAGAE